VKVKEKKLYGVNVLVPQHKANLGNKNREVSIA
jgi:hypothetical protein